MARSQARRACITHHHGGAVSTKETRTPAPADHGNLFPLESVTFLTLGFLASILDIVTLST